MTLDCATVAGSLPLDALFTGELLPYARVVRGGLAHFLERLPADRRQVIDRALQSLPDTTPPPEVVVTLLACCPTLHKLGQTLARDRRLPPALRTALQQLERRVPTIDRDTLHRAVEREVGDLASHGITLGDRPLAEASVAAVLPFDSPDGAGVFKVLKPDIERHLAAELTVWEEVAACIDGLAQDNGLPRLGAADLFGRVRRLLLSEVQPAQEQRHLAAASRAYGRCPDVQVPELLAWCTPRVTAMTRVAGGPVTGSCRGPAVARRCLRALVAQPILNTEPRALFHGDPHAGNLLVTDCGTLGIVDWSLCGHLTKAARERLAQVLVSAWAADATGVAQHCAALAVNAVPHAELRNVCAAALGNLAAPWIPGLTWLTGLLDAVTLHAGCRFDDDLLLFRRVLLILDGLAADLDPLCTLDRVMIEEGLHQHGRDTWLRPFTTPTSRAFGTHLSNLDLARLAWSTPPTLTRAWHAAFGVSP